MSEIPTEKLLPQGWQDMLSAHRKYTAQANDINNEIIDREMKISNVVLKLIHRFEDEVYPAKEELLKSL